MVSAQQLEDAAGHPRMMVYLKHYPACTFHFLSFPQCAFSQSVCHRCSLYIDTLDCRVGGPPPKRQPTSHCDTDNNLISPYDFADTYLPQYQIAMTVAGGVMCAYSAENGVPSCTYAADSPYTCVELTVILSTVVQKEIDNMCRLQLP